MNQESEPDPLVSTDEGQTTRSSGMPKPDVSKMGYNPADFAY